MQTKWDLTVQMALICVTASLPLIIATCGVMLREFVLCDQAARTLCCRTSYKNPAPFGVRDIKESSVAVCPLNQFERMTAAETMALPTMMASATRLP